jgi:prepilin-type processing-associated H-X9-DG protein
MLSLHQYNTTNTRFPGPTYSSVAPSNPKHNLGLSWIIPLTPYLGHEPLWKQARAALSQDPIASHQPPHTHLPTAIFPVHCPADGRVVMPHVSHGQRVSFTSFVGVRASGRLGSSDGFFGLAQGIRIEDIRDGTSNTLAIAERPPDSHLTVGWWYTQHPSGRGYASDYLLSAWEPPSPWDHQCRPAGVPISGSGSFVAYHYQRGDLSDPCHRYHFWSLHPTGANFAFADGSVRSLSYRTSPLVIESLATREGGEVVLGE